MSLQKIYILSFLVLSFIGPETFAQLEIAEFSTKYRQFNFQAIPIGDSILFSYDEVFPNGQSNRDVKWVSKDGTAHDIFCPVEVLAIESEGNEIYYYYWDRKLLRAYKMEVGTRTMNNLPESIEFKEAIVLVSYVNENLFLMVLKEGGKEISLLEIAGMNVIKTITYKLPISLEKFIKRNTYVEFYDEPVLDSFKGRARVKIFRRGADIYLVIDEKHSEPTKTNPNATHVLHLVTSGEVKYHRFRSPVKVDFGSFLHDDKLFQNHISKDKFSLVVYDLSGKQLMRRDIVADSLDNGKENSAEVNYRQVSEGFQGWDTFRHTFNKAGMMCDPVIVVSGTENRYVVQLGTYIEEGIAVAPTGLGPAAAMLSLFMTATIRQVTEGPAISRYFYFDLSSGTIPPAEHPPIGLLRGKIDEYERSRQRKNKSPFESKSYVPFLDGAVAIYRLKPREMIGVTQLVYFD